MPVRNSHHRASARAALAAAGTLLATLGIWIAPARTDALFPLVPVLLFSIAMLAGWRLAALSAALVCGSALALHGLADWPLFVLATAAVCGAEMLRRGVRPLQVALLMLLAGVAHGALLAGNVRLAPLLAGAAMQAGATVAAGCLLLLVIPRHGHHVLRRCRIRWTHVTFSLLSGCVSLAALILAGSVSDGTAGWPFATVMAAAFLATQLLGWWLESITPRIGHRYLSHRALAAAGFTHRRIRELPLEVQWVLDALHHEKQQLRRGFSRSSRKLVEAQRTASQAVQELQTLRGTLELKSTRLHELTRAREELRERVRVLLESPAEVQLFVSASGAIEAVNGAVATLLGHLPGNLVGTRLAQLVPPEHMLDHPLDLGPSRQLDAPTAAVNCEILRANGTRAAISADIHPFRIRTDLHYLVRIDGSGDRARLAQATMEEARALARTSNQSRDLFVATMSHELRTPLHGLIATLDMLRAEDLDADLQHHLAIARSSARALLKIANDVLDLSRLGSNLFPLERKLFALPEILRETVEEAQARAATLGLSVSVEISSPLPTSFWGDPARIKQILGNLVSNALKFTAHGGVTLRVAYDGRTCTIDVEDTGEGIPQDKREQIFDPFVQLKSRTAKQAGGAGLGLPISRRIAEAAGGSLVLLRSGAQGSTFRLTLSLEASDEAPPDEQSQRVFANPRGRILVVEDNPANRYVAQALLAGLKCPATIVKGGREALDLLKDEEFDLILMDCQMPGMDGYETTRRVRRLLQKNIPIIAMTANAMAEDRNECLAAGMDDFLPKPFGRQSLSDILSKWLDPGNLNHPQSTSFEGRLGLLPDLDEKVLDELWESLRWQRAPLERICSSFSGSLQSIIAALERGGEANRPALLRQLHALLGSSGMVGARRIEYLAGRLQAAVKENRSENLHGAVVLLRTSMERYERALNRKLDSMSATTADARTANLH